MAVDRLSMQFYSSLHPRGPHVQGIQFYLGNPGLGIPLRYLVVGHGGERTVSMDAVPIISSVWLPLVVAIIAIFGWTYKLNRDLRSDLQKEMSENKKEILDHFHAHIHDSGSGDVLLRSLASR